MMSMLNLGCGKHLHVDWVNVDDHAGGQEVLAYDVYQGLAFQFQSLRVLKPGGDFVIKCVGAEVRHWGSPRYSLARLLEATGFLDRALAIGESAISGFGTCLLDVEPNDAVHKPDAPFVKAEKT